MFLLPQIPSLHQPKPMITSTAIMIIMTTTITITTSTTITVNRRTMTTNATKMKKTIVALMKRQFSKKSYKHNC